MSLRRKLSLRSGLLFFLTTLIITVGTYQLFRYAIEQAYRQKLLGIAMLSAHFYLEKDEVNEVIHKSIEKEFKKISDEAIRLYRTDSTIYIDDSIRFKAPDEVIAETIANGKVFFKVGKRYFLSLLYKDNEGDFVIMVSGLNKPGQEQMLLLQKMLLLAGLAGMTVHVVLSVVLARRTFRPFYHLIEQVRSIRENDLHVRLNYPSGNEDEIKALINEFNYLLSRIESSVKVQRNFLKNATHEIKTPLAIIIGDIEVALQSSRTNEEYVSLLDSLKRNALHLRSILNSLMTLSHIEVTSAELITVFRIDEIIWQVVEKKMIEYRDRKINVAFDAGLDSNEDLLSVKGNRDLIFIAINNIVDNALKYSDAPVDIKIDATTAPLNIRIIDHGMGIPQDQFEAIFDMFYRVPESRRIPGHGIGLYLTKQILLLSNIAIKLDSEPGKGTVFTLRFP
ncbi:sensor histidine kinase [Chitinophaga rhizophila]|uniref:histidine kinase n=1 Tax=Chitinophaga rhizophila TaxID=2866212 RepID=A0ABS7GL35_9BACT|nr:HAMP domain-containing sensor histidine kinase [Chitinophaga rhizophila]MBW8687148.1 HAMP domain-containing histidine kinase [Chitinophaga rhizophila]